MRIRSKITFLIIILILFISALYSYLLYTNEKLACERGIYQKLFSVAHTARSLLPENFHNNIVDASSLSKEDYLRVVDKYNKLSVTLDLEYIWSLMKIDGKTVFTTGTSTSKDVTQGDHALFFETHSNPQSYDMVFDTMEVQFQTHNDKWGHIHAVLVPFKDINGRPYLFAASMKASEVEAILKKTMLKAALASLLVLFIGAMLALLIANIFAKPIIELTHATEEIAGGNLTGEVSIGGSKELRSLSKHINLMTAAIHEKIDQLTNSEENLRITLNSIGDGVIVSDTNGLVVSLNPVAENLTGWSQGEAFSKPLENIFHVINLDTRRVVENPCPQVLKTGEIVDLSARTLLVSKDKNEYLISDSGAPIISKSGDITGVVLVFRDITEQSQLEEQLNQSQKMDSIGQLAGGVAHDFNNMLSGILGAAELLEADLEHIDVDTNNLQIIFNASYRAADLTKKLLSFSRRGKVVSTPVDIHLIIDETLDILRRSIDKAIELSTDYQSNSSMVVGDPSQIESALLNLGVNSRDAMPNGGTLCFSTETVNFDKDYCNRVPFDIEPGTYIEISVSDSGKGIRKEMQEKIFEPFYTTKEVGQGTGLGLSAVYGTMVEHHGMVGVYSDSGLGTVFKLYFPLDETRYVQKTEIKANEINGSGCVLVIDDESIIRSTARQQLSSMGYDVILAENGVVGVETYALKKDLIDLVILDMVMPKMSGRDTFFELKKINPAVKVIVSSGFSYHASIAELLENGAIGTISKPYRRIDLGQLVARATSTSG